MKAKWMFGAAAVMAFLSAIGWWHFQRTNQDEGRRLTLYGNIDIRQVELSFHDPEHIAAMYVKEGDRVEKGQLLAEQDLERFRYALESAEARAAAQGQVVARLEAGSRPEEIRKARADVEAAEADVVFAAKELLRMETLARRKLASVEDADRARAELDAARARLAALRETLRLAVIGPRVEDIAEAKARLLELESQVKLARKVLDDARIIAPANGIIQDRILEPGDMGDAQTPVYTLALTDPVWARVYVPEKDLGKVRLGLPAEIRSDSFPDKVYPGWVGYLSPTAEFTPKTVETPELRTSLVYQARVFVCNPTGELRLGMPVTVTILPPPAIGQPEKPCPEAP